MACVLARDILPVASAQLCGSGFGPGTVPSPHHSGSKPPFSPGLLRKPFTSFDSPLINASSICHLHPSLPTLSRGLPRAAPKSSIACLLQLPPGHSLPSLGAEQAQNRSGERENHKCPGSAEGVSCGSPAGIGVTLDETQNPVHGAWRAGGTVPWPELLRYSGVPFFCGWAFIL